MASIVEQYKSKLLSVVKCYVVVICSVRACVRTYVCVCVCVCVRASACLCVCVLMD